MEQSPSTADSRSHGEEHFRFVCNLTGLSVNCSEGPAIGPLKKAVLHTVVA
jgi:hypothetical protein